MLLFQTSPINERGENIELENELQSRRRNITVPVLLTGTKL